MSDELSDMFVHQNRTWKIPDKNILYVIIQRWFIKWFISQIKKGLFTGMKFVEGYTTYRPNGNWTTFIYLKVMLLMDSSVFSSYDSLK